MSDNVTLSDIICFVMRYRAQRQFVVVCCQNSKMPAKPTWYGRLDQIVAEVSALAQPWIDRHMVQEILQVRPRRAQQILQPCLSGKVGNSGVASRESFVEHLKTLASGEDSFYEQRRRQRFAQTITAWSQLRRQQPQVLIEAPSQITAQEFATLPQGVELGPGMLSIRFSTTQEALEKLLALAMAIGRDFGEFERR